VTPKGHDTLFWSVIIISILGLVWAVWQSKRETADMKETENTVAATGAKA
jgi:hypothetical protein